MKKSISIVLRTLASLYLSTKYPQSMLDKLSSSVQEVNINVKKWSSLILVNPYVLKFVWTNTQRQFARNVMEYRIQNGSLRTQSLKANWSYSFGCSFTC